MHDRWARAAVLVPAMALAGCVFSSDPIVPAPGRPIDPRLLGAWEEVGGSDRAVISRASDRTYAIQYTSDNEVSRFEARSGSLGGRTILDVATEDGHLLVVLDIGDTEIRTSLLDPGPLASALRAGRIGLRFDRRDDRVLLHGTSDQLRSALAPYLAARGAFGGQTAWRRSGQQRASVTPCFEAAAWREADELFHRDPHWVGGDAASSVDLGGGRILWLFGDSWVDGSGKGTRKGARMVSNTVAIQTGADPSTASMRFYWRRSPDGGPAAFIPDEGEERHWFGNGVRVGDRLVLFLNRIRSASGGLGFESVTWTAWMIDNPDAEPSEWQMHELETTRNPLGVLVGFAAVLRAGELVYAFGSADPVKSHPVYAVRWPSEQVRRGELRDPEWWAGERLGWVPESSSSPRWPLFENGGSELSIHADQASGLFFSIQSQGFGAADVMMREAPALTGPWTSPRLIYRPAEYYRPRVMIYAAKAHPELSGGDLILTYATNTFDFGEQLTDPSIYYPRFVRLTRCRATKP